jgi:hypothetical protein
LAAVDEHHYIFDYGERRNPVFNERRMSIFEPSVFISREKEGVYDIIVDTVVPNACYTAGPYKIELPPATDLCIPDYARLVCKVSFNGGVDSASSMPQKPLRWNCQSVSFGSGKSHVAVHIFNNDALVGSNVVELPTDVRMLPSPWK